jgi:hypothetical protein
MFSRNSCRIAAAPQSRFSTAYMQEALMAWHRLRPEQTKRATIKVFGGPVYTATEIVHLHFEPQPE